MPAKAAYIVPAYCFTNWFKAFDMSSYCSVNNVAFRYAFERHICANKLRKRSFYELYACRYYIV